MSGEEVKGLTASIAGLKELIQKRTKEHQIALKMQIAQQACETCVVHIADNSLQEPIEVAPEPSAVLPVHERVEPVEEQPVQLEPPMVQVEAIAIEPMSVSKHLEPLMVHEEPSPVLHEEPSPVHLSNELILEYPDWSHYRVSKESIVDPRIDDDQQTIIVDKKVDISIECKSESIISISQWQESIISICDKILLSAKITPWCHYLSETNGQETKILQNLTSDNDKSESCESQSLKELNNTSDKNVSEYKSSHNAARKTEDVDTEANAKGENTGRNTTQIVDAILNVNLNVKSNANVDFIGKGENTGQNQYQNSDVIVMSENYQSSNSEKIVVSENFEKSISNNNNSLTHRLDVLSSHIMFQKKIVGNYYLILLRPGCRLIRFLIQMHLIH